MSPASRWFINRLIGRGSKKTSKLHVTGLCEGNSPVTGEFPAQMASYAENVSIWWRHHEWILPQQHRIFLWNKKMCTTSIVRASWNTTKFSSPEVKSVRCRQATAATYILEHTISAWQSMCPLQWRHNGCDGVSNHQPRYFLFKRLFKAQIKETSKIRVTGLCVGKSPGTGEFPAQRASNAENVSIRWRHHEYICCAWVSI